MANLLTIGCNYLPKNKITLQDGTSKLEPIVEFYFNCDARTANIIMGSGVSKGLRVDQKTGSLVKKVKADKYKDFIYGKTVLPKILDALSQYGYEYDYNNLDVLCASVEKTIDDYNQSDIAKNINSDVYDFINKLVEAMEKNMSDPNFKTFLDSIGNIRKFVGDDNLDVLTDLTPTNKISALVQWIKAGRQGHPTYLATKKQFMKAGYTVNPNATPMYLVRPIGVQGRSEAQTIADYGIQDYDTNDKRKLQVTRLSNDKDYGHNNAAKFTLESFHPFYDISDCTQTRQSNLVDNIGDVNKAFYKMDKDKDAAAKQQVVLDIQAQNKDILQDSTMCENAKKYAEKIGDKKLASVAANGNASDIVSFLAMNAESYLRNKAQRNFSQYNNQARELLKAVALKVLGLGDAQNDNNIQANCGYLKRNGKASKEVFIDIATDLDNIYYIMHGINESADMNSTLKYVLDVCGISVEEFKNMPETEEDAVQQINSVRENFVRTFNNMLKYRNQ